MAYNRKRRTRYAMDAELRRKRAEWNKAYYYAQKAAKNPAKNPVKKAPPNAGGNWTGVMDDWTEWHQLPFEVLYKMGDVENRLYCEWYMKAHPIDLEIVAENLHEALQKWRDEIEHLTGEM